VRRLGGVSSCRLPSSTAALRNRKHYGCPGDRLDVTRLYFKNKKEISAGLLTNVQVSPAVCLSLSTASLQGPGLGLSSLGKEG
jgi:hypothetical protein